MSNSPEIQPAIDVAVFSEKFAILCDLNRRHFTDATIASYYSLLTGQRVLKTLRAPISTEEFIAAADEFFCRLHFPSVDDFVAATIELRKGTVQQAEELPPLLSELSEEEQAATRAEIEKARKAVQRATGRIGLAMPIPNSDDRANEKPVSSAERICAWFRNPEMRKTALSEAMNRPDIEIVTDEQGNAIDLRVRSNAA